MFENQLIEIEKWRFGFVFGGTRIKNKRLYAENLLQAKLLPVTQREERPRDRGKGGSH
jgi:hypothetical protein